MIESLHLRGYRSLRDFRLKLGRVTVVSGENGTGKSNLYRSLALLQRAAEGRLAEAIADEGGMPSLLWAGCRPPMPVRRSAPIPTSRPRPSGSEARKGGPWWSARERW